MSGRNEEKYLKDVLHHWKSDYNWFTTEDVLNSYPQYIWKVDGIFSFDVLPVPEEWIRRNYPVVQFNRMPHGLHVAMTDLQVKCRE